MLRVIEEARMIAPDMEARITLDENGFYRREMRILPVEDWEPNEGWRIDYVSGFPLTLNTSYPHR